MEEIKTPFMEEVTFDYNKLQLETTFPAMKEIYKTFADNVDLMVFSETATSDSINEDIGKMAQKVLEVLVKHNVADVDMQNVIDAVQGSIMSVFSVIGRQKKELEKEFMARTIGARDPGTGKFTREYATFADLFNALEKIRIEQDKEDNQYFIIKKK